ncbi:MFS transporter [Microbispora triticiradicis]|uniref:MFS transporter n=2 Tax=Microbispora TaxID=2005 RepID=A0ABY3LWZ2_9ACTN|nr:MULTISPECIES: MFS transporter [Microbispora]TLP58573.1 MFS transporter [Microbispora fusca]TYB57699.1 MFS transporter [Microbispora tritici]
MAFDRYRRVLALPGVRALLLVGMIARIPLTGTGMTLTLHVVNHQKLGFLQAGLIGAASMAGAAIGSPLVGRFVDRRGLRPVMAVTTVVQLCLWCAAPAMPYAVLLPGALVGGLFSQPVFGAVRQCIAAMVPKENHQTGFALDSMGVELSYMVGPALAVTCVTAFGSTATMYGVAAGLVGAGVAFYLLDPPTRSAEEAAGHEEAVPRRQWLRPALFALFGMVTGLTFVLTTTELAVVAMLKAGDAGLVVALWCAYSLVGGFVYGGLPRGLSPVLLAGGLCALTVPVGLVGGGWWWLCLALLPSGLLCAPALSSTVDAVNRRVPAAARGEAMGLHGTSLTIGGALAGPIAGGILDAHGPAWAFAASGVAGLVPAVIAVLVWRRAPVSVPGATAPGAMFPGAALPEAAVPEAGAALEVPGAGGAVAGAEAAASLRASDGE